MMHLYLLEPEHDMQHSNWIITSINNKRRDILAFTIDEAKRLNFNIKHAVAEERNFLNTLNQKQLQEEWGYLPPKFQNTNNHNLGCA